MMEFSQQLDVTGLPCPLPLLKAKLALKDMQSGQVLYVIATDPASVRDFHAFAQHTEHTLMDSWEEEGKYFYLVKKR